MAASFTSRMRYRMPVTTPSIHEPAGVTQFRAALQAAESRLPESMLAQAQHQVVLLPEGVHTAALAAAALECEVGAIANSLLFEADGAPVLILTSGAHRVNEKKVATAVGVAKLKRATPEFVRTHTGQVIGGVSPLGHPEPVPTFIDVTLQGFAQIWAAAGHPAAVFCSNYPALLQMTNATQIEVQ